MTTVVNVVGARPQIIKAGPVSRALADAGVDELLVHTGQHYDPLLSESIMIDIGLRTPDVNLGVGSGSHGVQTAQIMEGIETVLQNHSISAAVTYGDTNSTIATALVCSKQGIYTAHVEAGLRSFNRAMPEEVNRVVTDHVSDLLLAPTQLAMENLAAEGLSDRSVETGDVMVDALRSIRFDSVPRPEWTDQPFYLATIHRAANTDDQKQLMDILTSFQQLDHPVYLLAHPRLAARLDHLDTDIESGSLRIHAPLSYAEMLATLQKSQGLFTDSGGLQKEAFILRVPCVTIRSETEWPETMEGGWNVLSAPGACLVDLAHRGVDPTPSEPFGDGNAALRIVDELASRL